MSESTVRRIHYSRRKRRGIHKKDRFHVNNKMKELGKSFSLSGQGTLAVLAAINIADEYFDAVAEADALRAEKEKTPRGN